MRSETICYFVLLNPPKSRHHSCLLGTEHGLETGQTSTRDIQRMSLDFPFFFLSRLFIIHDRCISAFTKGRLANLYTVSGVSIEATAVAVHGVGRLATFGLAGAGTALCGVQKADIMFAPASLSEAKQRLGLMI